jgi:ABC-type amino acid transport substrate-binding protein
MKKVTKVLSVVMAVGCMASVATGCGGETLAFGKEMLTQKSQLDALMCVNRGDADAAVIDSVMAGYYSTTGDLKGKVSVVEGFNFGEEQYGIAAKKGNEALMAKINEGLIALAGNGGMTEVATTFGLQTELSVTASTSNPYASATDGSWEEVKTSGTLVIGYTIFAPIAYKENGELTGFDTELAKAVVAYLNATYTLSLDVVFEEIDWDSKEALLENGTIDLVWNGMTITPEREEKMCISVPYLKNRQVAVVATSELSNYVTKDDFKKAIIAVESGSAGESVVKGADKE